MKHEKTKSRTADIAAKGVATVGVGVCASGTTAAIIGTTTMITTAGATSATIAGAGAAVGGVVGASAGAAAGASVGIATGGTAIAGTIPLAVTGATICWIAKQLWTLIALGSTSIGKPMCSIWQKFKVWRNQNPTIPHSTSAKYNNPPADYGKIIQNRK
ncbi:MAG: hypothetical protein IJZ19_14635 [Lentisphaeria bacterium]|nr:hypothetical protein [Lentisphaeria bacterium]